VLARNPQSAEAELPDAPVDLASWVNIHLRMAQATGDGVQLGHLPQASADLGVELDEPEQFVRPMEAEDQPAAGVRLEGVGELGDLAGGLVGEGERQAIVRQGPRQAVEIFARLRFDPGQGVPLRLRLDDADGPGVDVEHVVGLAGGQGKLPHGHPPPGRDIHLAVVLHDPAGLFQLPVDLLTGFLFGGHSTAGLKLSGRSTGHMMA
jgi:hypothetical protein